MGEITYKGKSLEQCSDIELIAAYNDYLENGCAHFAGFKYNDHYELGSTLIKLERVRGIVLDKAV